MMLYKVAFELFQFFICPFESGKFGKEGKKIHDIEYLENEESSLNEIIFHSS